MPRNILQECRHREDGSRTEPATHVIARYVVEHRVVGHLEDNILQLLESAHTSHLLFGHRVAEDEVAKAHVLFYQMTKIHIHLLRVLIDKVKTFSLCFLFINHLGTLHDEWYVLISFTNLSQQFESCLGIALFNMAQPTLVRLHGETRIRDNTQDVIAILLI